MSKSPRHLKQISTETPNDVSMVRHQDVSVFLAFSATQHSQYSKHSQRRSLHFQVALS